MHMCWTPVSLGNSVGAWRNTLDGGDLLPILQNILPERACSAAAIPAQRWQAGFRRRRRFMRATYAGGAYCAHLLRVAWRRDVPLTVQQCHSPADCGFDTARYLPFISLYRHLLLVVRLRITVTFWETPFLYPPDASLLYTTDDYHYLDLPTHLLEDMDATSPLAVPLSNLYKACMTATPLSPACREHTSLTFLPPTLISRDVYITTHTLTPWWTRAAFTVSSHSPHPPSLAFRFLYASSPS